MKSADDIESLRSRGVRQGGWDSVQFGGEAEWMWGWDVICSFSSVCVYMCVFVRVCVFIGGVELFSCPVTFVCKWICIQNSLLVKQHSASLQNRFCAPALQFWIREGRKERPSSCFLALRAAGGSQQCLKEKVNLLVNKWLPHCGGVQIIRGMFG